MSTTVPTKILFPNFGSNSHQQEILPTMLISQVKTDIVQKIIEENEYNKDKGMPKIRLFNLGKELKEDNQIKEYYNPTVSGDEMVIQVFVNFAKGNKGKSPTAARMDGDKSGDTLCNCSIF